MSLQTTLSTKERHRNVQCAYTKPERTPWSSVPRYHQWRPTRERGTCTHSHTTVAPLRGRLHISKCSHAATGKGLCTYSQGSRQRPARAPCPWGASCEGRGGQTLRRMTLGQSGVRRRKRTENVLSKGTVEEPRRGVATIRTSSVICLSAASPSSRTRGAQTTEAFLLAAPQINHNHVASRLAKAVDRRLHGAT